MDWWLFLQIALLLAWLGLLVNSFINNIITHLYKTRAETFKKVGPMR